MKNALSPPLTQTRYRRQVVGDACCKDEPSANPTLSSFNPNFEAMKRPTDICCETIDPVGHVSVRRNDSDASSNQTQKAACLSASGSLKFHQ